MISNGLFLRIEEHSTIRMLFVKLKSVHLESQENFWNNKEIVIKI